MDAQVFWEVIGNYNSATWAAQCMLLALIIAGVILAYFGKAIWLPKFALGATNLFLGVVFFLVYGTEPIQTYFAAPLFTAAGLLFLWDAVKFSNSAFIRFSRTQWILLCLVALYPLVSLLLGHSFPQIVVYVMPCPIISLSIVIYTCYEHQNKVLLALMTIWGLTGVKSFFFNALEDVILLICGVYCLFMLVRQIRKGPKKRSKATSVISVSSVFRAPAEKIWGLLARIDTLQTIAKPYAYFTPLESVTEWKYGAHFSLVLKVFGIFSFGVHQIRIVEFDKANWTLETNESNHVVKVWNHAIKLQPLPDGNTRYTDTVTLDAGKLTMPVKIWSLMFYRHRKRKWRKLLKRF